jgi:hypothetical protein
MRTTAETEGKRAVKSSDNIDLMEEARKARRAILDRDKVFLDETQRIEGELNRLLNDFPGVFAKFFREFGELSVRLQNPDLEQFLTQSPARAREILQSYIAYTRRFRVWFLRRNGKFKIYPAGPWQTKFRAQLVDGFFSELNPEAPGVEVVESARYADYDLPVPTAELQQLLSSGKAKLLQLDDKRGKSAIHEIEDIAYDPDSITFILHKSDRPYLFCLVGENVGVDSLWRKAGKAVNSLQIQLYNRRKVGRPRELNKWKKAAQLRERPDSKPLKEKAFELLDDPENKPANLGSAQSFLSKAGKRTRAGTKPKSSTKPTTKPKRPI